LTEDDEVQIKELAKDDRIGEKVVTSKDAVDFPRLSSLLLLPFMDTMTSKPP
jgi:hypothetical protein